jgi:DNA polymerase-3 subunit epsilon
MSVLEGPLVFVDIETTGMSFSRGRVIEVAAIRVEDGKVAKSFSSLIDPGMDLPPFISGLTGIHDRDLQGAPSFYDISEELYSILEGAVFVAHNVRFDYGFLKHEFQRLNQKFNPKLLCTVRLSKALYPGVRGHKLADLITRCGIEVSARHRAYEDAKAMWQFIQHARQNFPAPLIDQAISQQIKSPSLPKGLAPELVKKLPEQPGVYIFQDEAERPLYIGKSVNIKKRVLSHFTADHQYESEFKISQQIFDIKTVVTAGELEALLLESKLIKDLQPLYNRQLRRRRKMTLARKKLDSNGYITHNIEDAERIDPDELSDIMGVYTTKSRGQSFLRDIAQTYGLCPRLMGLEAGKGACFSYQLKRCQGACAGQMTAAAYNASLLSALDGRRLQNWPFASPILIEEKSDSDIVSSIVVDQWCVIADIKQQPDCEPDIRLQDKMFDIDTYKILRSFIADKAHRLKIKPVPIEWVKEIALNAV